MSAPTDHELDEAARWIGQRLTLLLDSIPDDVSYTAITPNDRGRFERDTMPRQKPVRTGECGAETEAGKHGVPLIDRPWHD